MSTDTSLLLVTQKPIECNGKISFSTKWVDQGNDALIVYNYSISGTPPAFLRVKGRIFQRCCERYYLDVSEYNVVSTFFDFLSENYSKTIIKNTNVDAYKWAFLALFNFAKKAGWVLDIGAGHGFGLKIYSKIPHGQTQLVALDMSRKMLSHCPKGPERIAGDAFALPISNKCLSGVIAVYMLHYLSTPEKVIKEIARTLIPEGVCSFVIYRHDPHKVEYPEYLKKSGFQSIQVTEWGCEPPEYRIIATKLREDEN
jgi:ubiquinone/menaquinone biosynthesis C-methylase UbiE